MTPHFARRWILRTFLGWAAGFVLAIVFIIMGETLGLREVQFPLALGMGLGVGLLQSRMTAEQLGEKRSWVLASTLGLAAPFIIADVLRLAGQPLPYSITAFVGLGGVTAGIAQWRLLRRHLSAAAWWLVASPIGWLGGGFTVWINEELMPRTPGLIGALQYVGIIMLGGIVLGAVSAIALRLCSGRDGGTQDRSAAPMRSRAVAR
jgi:hypothetical protein